MPDATVFIVDDDKTIREALRWLMETASLSVKEYRTADDFFAVYDENMVGCLLLDVRMPGMSGIELQRRIASNGEGLPIIIITGHADVPMAIEAMKNGVFDFIEKPFNNQSLLDIVQKAIEKSILHIREQAKKDDNNKKLSTLTPRERQVLDFVVKGETSKSVAHNLGISKKTVDSHRAKIMKKLSARSLADLVGIYR